MDFEHFNKSFFLTQNLSVQNIYSETTMNASGIPNERAFHCDFVRILMLLLAKLYPTFTNRILVEVKERDVQTNKRSKALDILVRDEMKPPLFGFEFAAGAGSKNFVEHCVRSETYSRLHGCQIYMVNFLKEHAGNSYYIGEKGYTGVTPVNIEIVNGKDPGELWEAAICYSSRKVTSVPIHSSQWNMLFKN